jgi:hypothetical protein
MGRSERCGSPTCSTASFDRLGIKTTWFMPGHSIVRDNEIDWNAPLEADG